MLPEVSVSSYQKLLILAVILFVIAVYILDNTVTSRSYDVHFRYSLLLLAVPCLFFHQVATSNRYIPNLHLALLLSVILHLALLLSVIFHLALLLSPSLHLALLISVILHLPLLLSVILHLALLLSVIFTLALHPLLGEPVQYGPALVAEGAARVVGVQLPGVGQRPTLHNTCVTKDDRKNAGKVSHAMTTCWGGNYDIKKAGKVSHSMMTY
jgi:hypothetical protein